MILNKKMTLVLSITIMSLVAGKPGTMCNLKDTAKSPVKVMRIKGKDKPAEVDLTLKMQTSEKEVKNARRLLARMKSRRFLRRNLPKWVHWKRTWIMTWLGNCKLTVIYVSNWLD